MLVILGGIIIKNIMSQEYIASIAILVVSVLKIFGIEVQNDVITSLVVAILALVVAIRRKMRGDINVLGMRKS